MTRYHATKDGLVQFTAQEEIDRDAEESAVAAAALALQDPTTPEGKVKRKSARASDVAAIVVTTGGKDFDGNENAQNRLMRKIAVMENAQEEATMWTLADDTRVSVTLIELKDALRLAVAAQDELWPIE